MAIISQRKNVGRHSSAASVSTSGTARQNTFPVEETRSGAAVAQAIPAAPESSPVPYALTHFDELPDSGWVPQKVVEGYLGCSGATVWRLVKRGGLITRKLSVRRTGCLY